MRFQERDGKIISTVWMYGGFLEKRHIHKKFWDGKTERAMLKRLSTLVENSFLARPTKDHRKFWPGLPPIYWLALRGAQWLAEWQGIEVDLPKNEGENQIRKYHQKLRENGLRWEREPPWGKVRHDLFTVDVRIEIERSIEELANIVLGQWVLESEFRSNQDRIEFEVKNINGKSKQVKRGICPDGFFLIEDEERRTKGEPFRLPCLLEIDMATHDNPSFGREKAAPYAAYIKSNAYKNRFGLNTGIWLVITTGDRRMRNIMKQTELMTGNDRNLFLFTTQNRLKKTNLLTDPIWWSIGQSEPESLITG